MAEPQATTTSSDTIPHPWWQRPGIVPGIMLVVFAVLVATIIAGYYFAWPWAGLTAYIDPKGDYHPDKTLWDWLSLLFVPVVIGGAAYAFRRTEQEVERQRAEQRVQAEQALAEDAQREAALQSYIDRMTQLLLENNLRASDKNAEVRIVARTLTLTVLPRLDPRRKRAIVQFLYESELIGTPAKTTPVVQLVQADLSGADLQEVKLQDADLSGADLSGADLSFSDLKGARLRGANLNRAHLQEAHLNRADLEAARLFKARLETASLRGANLRKAHLEEADLWIACLEGADLQEANLRKAHLEGASLTDIQYDDATRWPDGFTPPPLRSATNAPQKDTTP